MRDIQRIFISDVHMAAPEALEPATGQPYGWLTAADARRLGDFLVSAAVRECDQLIVNGDTVDLQICPHDVTPPTALHVLQAPHNQPIVDGIRAFANTPGKTVILIEGNHDLGMKLDDAHYLAPSVNFVSHYDEFPLRVRHGHEGCLFNAPDPKKRPYPLGYFISRFVATAAARGLAEVGLNLQLIFHSGHELWELLKDRPLAECVFDAVCKAAHVSLEDEVKMPGGGAMKVGAVRATYQNLVREWKSSSVEEAVLAEWEPFYALPIGKPYLHVIGHSHEHKYAHLHAGGDYLNLGAWCSKEAYFARTWLENHDQRDEMLCAELFRWDPGSGPHSASTRVRVPTK